jgi:Cdc6-like AAA superfamily ATPase
MSTETRGLPPRIPLIGRTDDLAAVQEWLGKASVVTVAGTGGIGKTALATVVADAVAAHYADGVMFVDLAKISEPLFIPAALALALGFTAGGEDPLAEVIHAQEGQRKLLLIDNCEHLLPSIAGVIDRLSTGLEGVRILPTSREPLRIRGEHMYLWLRDTGSRDTLTTHALNDHAGARRLTLFGVGAPPLSSEPSPTLGQHNQEVLSRLLGLTLKRITVLADAGIIGDRAV